MLFWFSSWPSQSSIKLLSPTWNSGTVDKMSMMMEARRKRELTITNTLAGAGKPTPSSPTQQEWGFKSSHRWSTIVNQNHRNLDKGGKVCITIDYRYIVVTTDPPPENLFFFICTMLQFLTLAAFEELGSSKSFQMTFLRLAQHIPSNGCGCKGNFLPDNHQFPSDANFFAPKTFITTIFLFREGSFEIRFRFSHSSTQRL